MMDLSVNEYKILLLMLLIVNYPILNYLGARMGRYLVISIKDFSLLEELGGLRICRTVHLEPPFSPAQLRKTLEENRDAVVWTTLDAWRGNMTYIPHIYNEILQNVDKRDMYGAIQHVAFFMLITKYPLIGEQTRNAFVINIDAKSSLTREFIDGLIPDPAELMLISRFAECQIDRCTTLFGQALIHAAASAGPKLSKTDPILLQKLFDAAVLMEKEDENYRESGAVEVIFAKTVFAWLERKKESGNSRSVSLFGADDYMRLDDVMFVDESYIFCSTCIAKKLWAEGMEALPYHVVIELLVARGVIDKTERDTYTSKMRVAKNTGCGKDPRMIRIVRTVIEHIMGIKLSSVLKEIDGAKESIQKKHIGNVIYVPKKSRESEVFMDKKS